MPPVLALVLTAILLGVFVARFESRGSSGAIAVGLFFAMPVTWHGVSQPFPQLALAPFFLLFLLAFDQYFKDRRTTWAALGGVALGAMIDLHLAGIIVAASLAGLAVLLLVTEQSFTAILALAAGVSVAALPWAVRISLDPSPLAAAITHYGLYDATRFNVAQGLREMTTWLGFTVRSEVYWDAFNPAFLFLGAGGLVESALHPRMFWLPFALPLVVGILRYLRRTPTPMEWVVLGAFFATPCVVAVLAQPPIASRLVLMAPAAAIIATRAFTPRGERPLPPAFR